jgi:hypothetical protein
MNFSSHYIGKRARKTRTLAAQRNSTLTSALIIPQAVGVLCIMVAVANMAGAASEAFVSFRNWAEADPRNDPFYSLLIALIHLIGVVIFVGLSSKMFAAVRDKSRLRLRHTSFSIYVVAFVFFLLYAPLRVKAIDFELVTTSIFIVLVIFSSFSYFLTREVKEN